MKKIHTHYDNLKVARTAPPEIVKAAYRALSQKFHPDRNPNDAEAARIMAIINASYEVLSNPVKRLQHDKWIEQQEASPEDTKKTQSTDKKHTQSTYTKDEDTTLQEAKLHVTKSWGWYVIAIIFIGLLAITEDKSPPPGPKPYKTSPIPERPQYIRPVTAPNGNPWPNSAGYVKGYKQLHTSGLSTVTVDNTQNSSDVFVKLVSLDGAEAYPTRHFYIPAFSQFTLNKVTPGTYDIRYRDLSNGALSRSESFTIKEAETENGTRFSKFRMTLYKVHEGNMKTYDLPETEF